MKTFPNPIVVFLFIGILMFSVSTGSYAQGLEPEQESSTYVMFFDADWKVLRIASMDTTKKVFPAFNRDGTPNPNRLSAGYTFDEKFRFNSIKCSMRYQRMLLLTEKEASDYVEYGKTSISARSSVRDYYLDFQKVDGSSDCQPVITNVAYHPLFNRDSSKEFPLQAYMQRPTFMAITSSGQDSIVADGYTLFMDENGKPANDGYKRHYGDYLMVGSVSPQDYGRQDDIYIFEFRYKSKEYITIVSSLMYKAFFLTDPYNSKNSMAVVVRNDGSVDYIVGELDDLYKRYWNGNLPRIETNTTQFLNDYIAKYPYLLLWNIKKTTFNLKEETGKIGDAGSDVSFFARLIENAYLVEQGVWNTLIDNDHTWLDPTSTLIGAEVFF